MCSWEFLGIPRNSKSSQNWSLTFPEIPSNSKLLKSELICIVGNFWEFLGIPRNSQKTGSSVCKGYLQNWEFLRISRNSQKTWNSVRKGWSSTLPPWRVPCVHKNWSSMPLGAFLATKINKEQQPHQKVFLDIFIMVGTHNWHVWVKHVKH